MTRCGTSVQLKANGSENMIANVIGSGYKLAHA
jgi:hypothetical protein